MAFSRERETDQEENDQFILPEEPDMTAQEDEQCSNLAVTQEETSITTRDEDEIDDEDEDAEEEEEYVAPEDQKVFGMPRFCFWGVMFGFALGYILCGLVGIITQIPQSNSAYIAGCGIAGYVIAYFLYKRKKKAQESAIANSIVVEPTAEEEDEN